MNKTYASCHMVEKTCDEKEGDNAHFLKTHITGTLSHGNGLALCFVDLMHWPQDANPTTNALISTFRQIIAKVKILFYVYSDVYFRLFDKPFYGTDICSYNPSLLFFFVVKRGSLPPVLYLQLDNCYRDCKNIHVLGFCALLVKAGVFNKVVISLLPFFY